jgi:hypothetical protein
MARIPFDPDNPDPEAVRQILLQWLRPFSRMRDARRDQIQLDQSAQAFEPFVEFQGRTDYTALSFSCQDVLWQLIGEGIIAPGQRGGSGVHGVNLPWLHVTPYGEKVLQETEPSPHDPTGYLSGLTDRLANPDDTVMSYLREALNTFRRGSLVASMVMLGVAAEGVFLLLAESVHDALKDQQEKTKLRKILSNYRMKPKQDRIERTLLSVNRNDIPGFPDNVSTMLFGIYDLLRVQRNELGHPQELPPSINRWDAHARLVVFSSYYVTAEKIRDCLRRHSI